MITLLWRTDVHLADGTPRSRTDDWAETVLGKLIHVGELARKYRASAVIDGGDFFNLKSPGRNSHALIRRVFEAHRGYPCPVYANVGNHDCVYGDYSFLPQQPLGVLYESGVFRRLYDEHEAVFVQEAEDGSPRIKVRVVGVPYHGTRYDMDRFARIQRGDEDYLVVAAHLLASPTETSMFEGEDIVRYDALDAYAPDVYLFGHWHRDQGVARTPGGKAIINIGSLTRGSLSQDDLERVPSVAVMRFGRDAFSCEKVPVRHLPAPQVFDLQARDIAQVQQTAMEEFVEHLAEGVLASAPSGSLRDAVADIPGLPDAVREAAVYYIEKAGGQ